MYQGQLGLEFQFARDNNIAWSDSSNRPDQTIPRTWHLAAWYKLRLHYVRQGDERYPGSNAHATVNRHSPSFVAIECRELHSPHNPEWTLTDLYYYLQNFIIRGVYDGDLRWPSLQS